MVPTKNRKLLAILLGFGLIVLIIAAFWRVSTYDFVNLDDDAYVYENHQLQKGFTTENVIWALITFHAGNWHPLTWLSHILDFELYGLEPGGHHRTSVQIHIVNSLLLFFILQYITGTLWRSAFAAALFALHPIHVESVAWVSARKDVLSTFWGLLTIAVYYRYVMRPRFWNYLIVVITLSLGLMAKPMLVTFPFVLLLLDFWPLQRLHSAPYSTQSDTTCKFDRRQALRLFLEKVPLFIPVAISSVLTFMAEQSVGSLPAIEALPVTDRFANALISYVKYVYKTIWPHHLAVYYPYPESSPAAWKIAGAGTLIMMALLAAWRLSKRFPYILVGLLWYLGTLVPVIGLVQVGGQAMADRYTYIPLIGILIIIAWGAYDLLEKQPFGKMLLSVSGLVTLALLTTYTYIQVGYWQDSVTLYQHAIKVTADNYFAYNGLGAFFYKKRNLNAAIYNYKKALRIKPDYADAHSNLGLALFDKGKIDEAIIQYKKALKIRPDNVAALYNLANALAEIEQLDEAVFYYKEALKFKPGYWEAFFNLANTEVRRGDLNAAAVYYKEALAIDPQNAKIRHNYGNLFFRQGKYQAAMLQFAEAIKIDPGLAETYDRIGLVLAYQGKFRKARVFFLKAIQIKPNYKEARQHLEKYNSDAVIH